MKILIHALGVNMGGAMRHLTNFLPELGRQDGCNHYTVLVRNSFPLMETSPNIHLKHISEQFCKAGLIRLWWDIIYLPTFLKQNRFDMLVSLANFGPIWTPCRHILFECNTTYYCNAYLNKVKGKEKWETLLRQKLTIACMKHADLIVTPSDATTAMIRKACPAVADRSFQTLYLGYNHNNLNNEPLGPELAKHLINVNGKKLLYPSHAAPYKGFEILFKALAHLKKRRSDFVLFAPISSDDWPKGFKQYELQIRALGIQDHVIFLGRIPQNQIKVLYQQCDFMVYPSLCESFGFSMIEAMGSGLPIIAADTPINREICADAACYYSPLDPVSAATTINNVLFNNDVVKKLYEMGRKRVASFDWSWRRHTIEFLKLLEKVNDIQ